MDRVLVFQMRLLSDVVFEGVAFGCCFGSLLDVAVVLFNFIIFISKCTIMAGALAPSYILIKKKKKTCV